MLRITAGKLGNAIRGTIGVTSSRVAAVRALHGSEESAEDFDKRYEKYFSREGIDGWEIRKGMNDLLGMDLVPSPKIIEAGLRGARRVNDIALAIRWLEGCKDKCGDQKATLYPYLLEKITPTLKELGIPTIEELGYDQPELALKSVYDL
ncbi:cytochrome c oxidase subunit 5A, mitochondrial [Drosophila guanche]|uniref:Cytochrome c oxidase subunit 5A, mitochondrial n=1 Tax=Drosophila guanche TaxID=7266 RepID=A0A3B0KPC9_DROGU|nr:cytochrome c oxidase subunit 5A, mitochondrial [Drosophila guanche]SPP88479.1 blast:Cytochrome c oxidase subunit 5A%2C mitochondrial [Drosophila guanche]